MPDVEIFIQFPRQLTRVRQSGELQRVAAAITRSTTRRRRGSFVYVVSQRVFVRIAADIEADCLQRGKHMVGGIVDGWPTWLVCGVHVGCFTKPLAPRGEQLRLRVKSRALN